VAPFLERFYELIDKMIDDRVTFEEFLGPLVTFCLFAKEEMITCKCIPLNLISKVVFSLLDTDRDNELSKKDLFRLFMMERDDYVVFPFNNNRVVEIIPMERGDKIHKSEFANLVA
jgi:hypothetical protein